MQENKCDRENENEFPQPLCSYFPHLSPLGRTWHPTCYTHSVESLLSLQLHLESFKIGLAWIIQERQNISWGKQMEKPRSTKLALGRVWAGFQEFWERGRETEGIWQALLSGVCQLTRKDVKVLSFTYESNTFCLFKRLSKDLKLLKIPFRFRTRTSTYPSEKVSTATQLSIPWVT